MDNRLSQNFRDLNTVSENLLRHIEVRNNVLKEAINNYEKNSSINRYDNKSITIKK